MNQIYSIMLIGTKETETIKFRDEASKILDTLVNSENCLALREGGTTEKIVNLTALNYFQSRYPDTEPDCAKNYDYGYYIEVEKFEMPKIKGKLWEPKIPPGNRDIVLILDNSGSICCLGVDWQCHCPEKGETVLKAAESLIKCADKTDRISIIIFSPECGVQEIVSMTSLDTDANKNNVIKDIYSNVKFMFATPLIKSVDKASEIIQKEASQSKNRMILLFTDGRETCCQDCWEFDPQGDWCCPKPSQKCNCGSQLIKDSMGTCCCLEPCNDALCNHAKSANGGIAYLKNNNIPIYSVFLGGDVKGIEEVTCLSRETGGDFYNVSSAEILPQLFCEFVGAGEQKIENYQKWNFGSQNHSVYEALESSVSVSIPVMIRISENTVQPGQITIKLYKGELEELVGLIDKTCETGLDEEQSIHLTYPVELKNNTLCMIKEDKEFCRKFTCNLNVNFEGINSPGTYTLFFSRENNIVRVKV